MSWTTFLFFPFLYCEASIKTPSLTRGSNMWQRWTLRPPGTLLWSCIMKKKGRRLTDLIRGFKTANTCFGWAALLSTIGGAGEINHCAVSQVLQSSTTRANSFPGPFPEHLKLHYILHGFEKKSIPGRKLLVIIKSTCDAGFIENISDFKETGIQLKERERERERS